MTYSIDLTGGGFEAMIGILKINIHMFGPNPSHYSSILQ